MSVAGPEANVPELVRERLATVRKDRAGVELLRPEPERGCPLVSRALVQRRLERDVVLCDAQFGGLAGDRLVTEAGEAAGRPKMELAELGIEQIQELLLRPCCRRARGQHHDQDEQPRPGDPSR